MSRTAQRMQGVVMIRIIIIIITIITALLVNNVMLWQINGVQIVINNPPRGPDPPPRRAAVYQPDIFANIAFHCLVGGGCSKGPFEQTVYTIEESQPNESNRPPPHPPGSFLVGTWTGLVVCKLRLTAKFQFSQGDQLIHRVYEKRLRSKVDLNPMPEMFPSLDSFA